MANPHNAAMVDYDSREYDPQDAAMDTYLKEISDLTKQRRKIEARIAKIEKVLRGMIDLLDSEARQIKYMEKLDDIKPPAGLSDAILQVLRSEKRPFFPTEIRDRIKEYLTKYSNKMAPVHTTLKRLQKNPLVFVERVEVDGKPAYQSTMFRYEEQVAAIEARQKLEEKVWP